MILKKHVQISLTFFLFYIRFILKEYLIKKKNIKLHYNILLLLILKYLPFDEFLYLILIFNH